MSSLPNQQLELQPEDLLKIGFQEKIYPEDEISGPKTTYEIECPNGCFIYNPSEEIYRWYHKTIIGEGGNFIHLDITGAPELFILLSIFKVKYNLFIL